MKVNIQELRAQVERTLVTAVAEPDTALDRACELDALKRIQTRVDPWLSALMDEHTRPQTFGEGPA